MELRIGRVIETYPEEGKVKVTFEDTSNSSLALPMLTMNNEYMMPSIGARVATAHFDSGSSQGVVLGTYYYEGNTPSASSGFRKDLGNGAYIKSGTDITLGANGDIDFSAGNTYTSVKAIVQAINQNRNDINTIYGRLDAVEKVASENADKIADIEDEIKEMDYSSEIEALEKRIEALEKKG